MSPTATPTPMTPMDFQTFINTSPAHFLTVLAIEQVIVVPMTLLCLIVYAIGRYKGNKWAEGDTFLVSIIYGTLTCSEMFRFTHGAIFSIITVLIGLSGLTICVTLIPAWRLSWFSREDLTQEEEKV